MTETRPTTMLRLIAYALRTVVAVLLLTMAASMPARAESDEPPFYPDTPQPPPAKSAPTAGETKEKPSGIPYEVEITGVDDEKLKDLMKESSQLIALQDQPPTTLSGVSRRIEEDQARFDRVLRSEGYYAGTISHRIDADTDPVRVTISVDPGPPFLLSAYSIAYVGKFADDPPPAKPALEDLGLELGARAEAAKIVAAGSKLLGLLRNEARPLAKQTDRRAVADFREQTLSVEVSVDPGPKATFGPVTVTGLTRTNEDYIRQWVSWKEGDPYTQKQMDTLQSDLVDTGLFSSVIVQHANEVDERSEIAITISVEEDKPRAVGAGVSVSTDRGVGGRVFWRHINLFGNNESLELSAQADFLEQGGAINFERPNFGMPGRSVYAGAKGGLSDTDAYEGFDSSLSGGIKWPVSKRWTASVGGLVEYSNLKDNDSEDYTETVLWGIPGTLAYDGTNNKLDPKKGVRLNLTLVPYAGTSDKPLLFNFAEVGVSGYYPLDRERRYVLAGRTRVGSIVGESRDDIPANKRIYAGGGDSIRGYAYQLVGPLNDDDDPLGGRSKIEFSGELRARVYGDFGVVPFVAAGNAYDSEFPDFSGTLQWAAGLGFRYYTAIGPIRFDVGVPLNPRNVDDPFQLYFSIGQAF